MYTYSHLFCTRIPQKHTDMRLISQVAKEIWVCDRQTVTKYVGEISDFKMQLRRDMQRANLMDADGKVPVKSNLVPLTPMNKSGPAAVPMNAKLSLGMPHSSTSLLKHSHTNTLIYILIYTNIHTH